MLFRSLFLCTLIRSLIYLTCNRMIASELVLMNDMTEENRKLKLIIFPGETVVIDEYGKRIVACPTEDEAEEYIREQEE